MFSSFPWKISQWNILAKMRSFSKFLFWFIVIWLKVIQCSLFIIDAYNVNDWNPLLHHLTISMKFIQLRTETDNSDSIGNFALNLHQSITFIVLKFPFKNISMKYIWENEECPKLPLLIHRDLVRSHSMFSFNHRCV